MPQADERGRGEEDESRSFAWKLVALAALPRLLCAFLFTGTEDVGLSERMAQAVVHNQNPYSTGLVAWPPLWPVLASLPERLALASPIPFDLALKLLTSSFDILITLALFSWMRERATSRRAFRFALLYALNPLSIYVTAVHGQFDSIPAAALLLSAIFVARPGKSSDAMASSVWLSIGIMTKTWPLFALPPLLAFVNPFRKKLAYVATAVLPSAVILAIFWMADPNQINEKVFHYRSNPGWWGFTGILDLLGRQPQPQLTSLLFYTALALTALVFWRRREPLRGATAMLLAFLFFAPGFGTQYLLWVLPVALLSSRRAAVAYTLLAALTMVCEATFRPFNGVLGETLKLVPSHAFHVAYGGARDRAMTIADRIPVWFFAGGWWVREMLQRRRLMALEDVPVSGQPN